MNREYYQKLVDKMEMKKTGLINPCITLSHKYK